MSLRELRLLGFRSLRSRPLRSLVSLFGIVLGVAGLLAIGATNAAALDAVQRLVYDTSGRADLLITEAKAGGSGMPATVLARARGVPGVAAAVPSVQAQTAIADQGQPEEVGLSMFGATMGGLVLYGVDPSVDERARTYNLIEGSFHGPDLDAYNIVLVESVAKEKKLSVGSRVSIVTPSGVQKLRLIGLIAREGPGQLNNGNFGVVPLAAAQKLFNRGDRLDQIDVVAEAELASGAGLDALKQVLQERVGADRAVTYPASQGERMVQMLQSYQIGLNFMSSVALFVGAFLVYNAFSMSVVERTREIGFLRTLGMTRRQVVAHVLLEAALLGVVGVALGVGFGMLLARGLAAMMGAMLGQTLATPQLPPDVLATAVVMGIGVTLFAAFVPAWQAGTVSPLEAMRVRGNQRPGRFYRHSWKAGTALLALSILILVVNPFPYDVQFRLGGITVFGLFFGAALMLPAGVQSWERLARAPMAKLYGSGGYLGSANLSRARWRTPLTVTALIVGTAMIIVTRGMMDSFQFDLEDWLQAYIGGDLFVTASTPLDASVGNRLESVEGVAAAAPVRYFEVKWEAPEDEVPLVFMATEPAAYRRVTNFVFGDTHQDRDQAQARLEAGDAVFISSVIAEKHGLGVGDMMRLKTGRGPRDFYVAGVVVDYYNQGLVVEGTWNDMRRYFTYRDVSAFLVKVQPGQSIAAVRDRIDQLYGRRYHLTVESNQTLIRRAFDLMAQASSMFDVLALIAMVIASLGVVNTMTMNVLERTQEIGMLRSVGMTRRQVLAMIVSEASLMGLVGGVLGVVLGLVLARIFLLAMTAMSGYKLAFVVPVQGMLFALAVAWGVAQLAAILPALRSNRIRLLEAIHYE